MAKKDATDGERLCTLLRKQVIDPAIWPALTIALAACGRDEEWTVFVEEVVSTQLTGRLVTAGAALAEDLGGKSSIDSLEFEQKLRGVIAETTRFGLGQKKLKDRVYDLTARAVRATYGKVTAADDMILRREAGRYPQCFLCNRRLLMVQGPAVLTLPEEDRELAVEYEHIWPRSYGGDTTADNLALACHACNHRKTNFANWAMVDMQSLILGFNPNEKALGKVAGWRRFALTSWEAHRLADRESLTLKQAHLRLQSSVLSHPKVRRTADAADFFNLANHVGID